MLNWVQHAWQALCVQVSEILLSFLNTLLTGEIREVTKPNS